METPILPDLYKRQIWTERQARSPRNAATLPVPCQDLLTQHLWLPRQLQVFNSRSQEIGHHETKPRSYSDFLYGSQLYPNLQRSSQINISGGLEVSKLATSRVSKDLSCPSVDRNGGTKEPPNRYGSLFSLPVVLYAACHGTPSPNAPAVSLSSWQLFQGSLQGSAPAIRPRCQHTDELAQHRFRCGNMPRSCEWTRRLSNSEHQELGWYGWYGWYATGSSKGISLGLAEEGWIWPRACHLQCALDLLAGHPRLSEFVPGTAHKRPCISCTRALRYQRPLFEWFVKLCWNWPWFDMIWVFKYQDVNSHISEMHPAAWLEACSNQDTFVSRESDALEILEAKRLNLPMTKILPMTST